MARPPKRLKLTEIKPWNFYWAPPKSYYDEGKLDFFNHEYVFILPGNFGYKDDDVAVTVNAKETFDEFGFDEVEGEFELSYFFRVDDVPLKVERKLIVALFNVPSYLKDVIGK